MRKLTSRIVTLTAKQWRMSVLLKLIPVLAHRVNVRRRELRPFKRQSAGIKRRKRMCIEKRGIYEQKVSAIRALLYSTFEESSQSAVETEEEETRNTIRQV